MKLNIDKIAKEFVLQVILDAGEPCPYSPFIVNKDNVIKMLELIQIVFPKKRINRKISYVKKRCNSFERLLVFYYEILLSLENKALLSGFSVYAPIEKGYSNYNPEKLSLRR